MQPKHIVCGIVGLTITGVIAGPIPVADPNAIEQQAQDWDDLWDNDWFDDKKLRRDATAIDAGPFDIGGASVQARDWPEFDGDRKLARRAEQAQQAQQAQQNRQWWGWGWNRGGWNRGFNNLGVGVGINGGFFQGGCFDAWGVRRFC